MHRPLVGPAADRGLQFPAAAPPRL